MASEKDLWNSQLFEHVAEGHSELIQSIVLSGADVNTQNYKGNTPLMISAMNGHADCVTELLNAGADVNLMNNENETALNAAVTYGNVDAIVKLTTGADVNITNNKKNTVLNTTARLGYKKCVKALIAAEEEGNTCGKSDITALMWAAVDGDLELLDVLIRAAGADVNQRNGKEWTALKAAVKVRNIPCMKFLIKAGADVSDTLLWAAKNRSCHDLKTLLHVGVDVNISDRFGFSPLSWAVITGFESCVWLLLKAGAAVNTVIENNGIYLIATASSRLKKRLLALIHAESNVPTPENLNNVTFTCTAVNSNQETFDALIQAGADVNMTPCVGLSPLFLAVIAGSNTCIKQLLNAGADVNAVNM